MIKKPEYSRCGERVDNHEPLCAAGGNVKWCSRCGGALKKLNVELPFDPVIPSWVYSQKNRKQGLEQIFVHPCSQLHYSQQPRGGHNVNVP